MIDDPIAVLERELVGAARRQAAAAQPVGRSHRQLTGVAVAVAALLPVLAVVAALSLTGAPRRAVAPATATAASGPGGLLAELSVLRRAQRPSDLTRAIRGTARVTVAPVLLRRVVARFAAGDRVAVELDVSRHRIAGAPYLIGAFAMRTFPGDSRLFLTPSLTARQFARQGIVLPLGGRDVAVVVPDGVARVAMLGAGEAAVSARVRDNVAAVRVPATHVDAYLAAAAMRWSNAAGATVRSVAPAAAAPAPAPAPALSPSRALVDSLGVLRRPQRPADLSLPLLDAPALTAPRVETVQGLPVRRLVRLARVAPWGARVYLVPFAHRAWRADTIGLYTGAGGAPLGTAGAIAAGRAVLTTVAGRRLRVLALVPDGVASVEVDAAGRRSAAEAAVTDNVAAFQLPGRSSAGPLTMGWRNAAGDVIRRFRISGL